MVPLPLLIGLPVTRVSARDPWLAPIREGLVEGVILFERSPEGVTRNIESPPQLKTLIRDLQTLSPHPLLVAIDQEGGNVQRLRRERGFVETPSARTLAENPETAKAACEALADQLAELGINFNLAPVVDLDLYPANPIIGAKARSFSASSATVTDLARICLKAHRERHIATCLKHFPGHGSSRGDTHLGWVDVTDVWQTEELAPYRALKDEADAVLTAHVVNRRLDPEGPLSLSPKAIEGLLRQEIGFQGVVVTDDLQMGAITGHFGFEEALLRALAAGNDLVVIGNNLQPDPDAVQRAKLAIGLARQTGRLDEAKLTLGRIRLETLLSSVT